MPKSKQTTTNIKMEFAENLHDDVSKLREFNSQDYRLCIAISVQILNIAYRCLLNTILSVGVSALCKSNYSLSDAQH